MRHTKNHWLIPFRNIILGEEIINSRMHRKIVDQSDFTDRLFVSRAVRLNNIITRNDKLQRAIGKGRYKRKTETLLMTQLAVQKRRVRHDL